MRNILKFLEIAEKLKFEKRKTLLSNGEWESVASHTWMMGLLAILFMNKTLQSLSAEKVFKMIVVHDLAEAETGDIAMGKTFQNQKLDLQKRETEKQVMQNLIRYLPTNDGEEIISLWEEFEKNETAEAKFVKAIDKLESYLQVSQASDISYINCLGDGDIYWKIYCQDLQKHLFADEPILCEFWDAIKEIILYKMQQCGINPADYMKPQDKNHK